MAAEQTAKYGVAAIAIAIVIIAGAVASMSLATTTQSQTSSTRATTSQTGSQSVTTLQLGSSSSATSTQSSTTQGQGSSGILSIYLTDAPPSSPTLKYLLVNVSSLEMVYQGNGTSSTGAQAPNVYILTVPSNVGTDVNLSSLQGQSLLLGGANMPAGKIVSMFLNITGAKAFYTDGSTEQVQVVADGKLMVPIQFGLQANGSTDLTIDVTPNLANASQGVVLTPDIDATAVEKGQNGTTTETVTATESLPPITSTVTTTQTVTTPTTLTTTVTTPTTTTQTVTTSTTLPPITVTLTTTSTATTTTTQTSTTTSTVILPPTTTTVTTTSTTTSISTKTVTSTSMVTSTKTVTSVSTTTVTSTKSYGRDWVHRLEPIRNFSLGVMDGAYPCTGDSPDRGRHCPQPTKIPTKRGLI